MATKMRFKGKRFCTQDAAGDVVYKQPGDVVELNDRQCKAFADQFEVVDAAKEKADAVAAGDAAKKASAAREAAAKSAQSK